MARQHLETALFCEHLRRRNGELMAALLEAAPEVAERYAPEGSSRTALLSALVNAVGAWVDDPSSESSRELVGTFRDLEGYYEVGESLRLERIERGKRAAAMRKVREAA